MRREGEDGAFHRRSDDELTPHEELLLTPAHLDSMGKYEGKNEDEGGLLGRDGGQDFSPQAGWNGVDVASGTAAYVRVPRQYGRGMRISPSQYGWTSLAGGLFSGGVQRKCI